MQTKLALVPSDRTLITAATLGAIAGVRSMAAPALLAHELSGDGRLAGASTGIERFLGSRPVSTLLALLAGGEMLADKTPLVPDRTSPGPLIGRAVIGSLTAAAYAANRRRSVILPALIGASTAIGSAYTAFHVRRLANDRLDAPDPLLGAIEDVIIVAVSKRIADEMERS